MVMSDSITFHTSAKTGRSIALNTNLDSIAILQMPTYAQLYQLLKEHDTTVIKDLWDNKFPTVREKDHCLEAFAPMNYTNTRSNFRFFLNSAVNVYLDSIKVRGICDEVRALSLDSQRDLLEQLRPASRKQFEEIASATAINDFMGIDLCAELESLQDVSKFILGLQERAAKGRRSDFERSGAAEQAIEVLTMLRGQGCVLLPAGFRGWKSTAKWKVALNPLFAGKCPALMNELGRLLKRSGSDSSLTSFGQVCVLMSTMESVDDLSPSLFEAIQEVLYKVVSRPDHARSVMEAFRMLWAERYPNEQIGTLYTRRGKNEDDKRTNGQFGWLTKLNPAMSAWQQPLATFVLNREANSKAPVIADLNIFCDFLLNHPQPPLEPEATQRVLHIRDVTFRNKETLMSHLEQCELNQKRKVRVLGYVREFFDWYRDWSLSKDKKSTADKFSNPVVNTDTFQSGRDSAGQTFRTALPSWLLRELRTTITKDDFAFPKEVHKQDICNVRDAVTGEIVREWWPGTAIILTILLDLPLRSHQARWLDSGEFDDILFDAQSNTEIANPSPNAVRGRKEGCLRLLHDSLRQESWIGAYINTNKTAYYKEEKRGYNIPYISPELASMLNQMRQWNKRFLPPLATLVTYYEEARSPAQAISAANRDSLPKIAPLFRDPRRLNKNNPPSATRVASLWLRVLRETEERSKREHNIEIQLTERNESGNLVWKYDLHTLRVSGISAMIESGVPLEVVSQFVAGHKTLVMTLWYYKNSPGMLREVIAKAHEKALSEGDFVGSSEFQENIETFSPFLLSKNALHRLQGGDEAFMALKQSTGLWAISSDGICPGTSCSSGGELEEASKRYGPVPGGRRCGLCRFWITGPAFLLGQMAEANNLIYVIRKKGLQLKESRDQIIELEEAGKESMARQMRSRVEALERELQIDLAEWQSRYAYAMSSTALLDEYVQKRNEMTSTSGVPAPLLTANSESELRLTLEQADEFVLLEHVTQMSNVVTGFKNKEAQLEKRLILSKVLSANGSPPLLLNLDQQQAEVAGNLLSSILLQYVSAQDRDRVFAGELKLRDIPALDEPLTKLTTELSSGAIEQSSPTKTNFLDA